MQSTYKIYFKNEVLFDQITKYLTHLKVSQFPNQIWNKHRNSRTSPISCSSWSRFRWTNKRESEEIGWKNSLVSWFNNSWMNCGLFIWTWLKGERKTQTNPRKETNRRGGKASSGRDRTPQTWPRGAQIQKGQGRTGAEANRRREAQGEARRRTGQEAYHRANTTGQRGQTKEVCPRKGWTWEIQGSRPHTAWAGQATRTIDWSRG